MRLLTNEEDGTSDFLRLTETNTLRKVDCYKDLEGTSAQSILYDGTFCTTNTDSARICFGDTGTSFEMIICL